MTLFINRNYVNNTSKSIKTLLIIREKQLEHNPGSYRDTRTTECFSKKNLHTYLRFRRYKVFNFMHCPYFQYVKPLKKVFSFDFLFYLWGPQYFHIKNVSKSTGYSLSGIHQFTDPDHTVEKTTDHHCDDCCACVCSFFRSMVYHSEV